VNAEQTHGEPDDLQRFVDCWNGGRFFDAHETLEPRWIATRDRGLRGLIQLAAAFHHLSNGNKKGARITLERAVVRLRDPQNAPCTLDQLALADFACQVLAQLELQEPAALVASRPRLRAGA
jgi:predicted metal-dependent hydrolase